MLLVAMLLGMQGGADAAIERYRTLTRAEYGCIRPEDPDEVVVCGARAADRYRLPIVPDATPGDPKVVDAGGERDRLLAVPQLPCGVGAFLSGCGAVGASTTMGGGRSPRAGQFRPLAR